jgi:ubiquinone/menaquinone biosynthesis C-methylase UbiE
MKSAPGPDPLVARLGSLADPVRLRLLALLERQELGVGELAEIVQLPQSSVSRHLKLLADQGWLLLRSAGTANLYRMANGELPDAVQSLWRLASAELGGWSALEQDRLRLARRLAERERERDSHSFFAGVAGEWETLRDELYGRAFTEAAITALLPPHWVVADLACGAGDVTVRLAPRVSRVFAVDRSPEMLAAARRRTRGLPNVELHEADLSALPMRDSSCDAALMLLALTHVEDVARALEEMARVLVPGGRAVVVDLLRHGREDLRRRMGQRRDGFRERELRALLGAAGLANVTTVPLPPEPQAKGPALLLATATKPPAAPRDVASVTSLTSVASSTSTSKRAARPGRKEPS